MTDNNADRATTIRAVLFDFGGVLAEEGFRTGLYALARRQGLDPQAVYRAAPGAIYDSGYVMGRGTEDDFWRLLQQRTGLRGEMEAMRQTIAARFVLRPRMLAIARALRHQGYITGILSDQTDWLDRLDAELHFFQYFDRVYNSYHLSKGKRDPSVFDDVARDLRLVPEQVVFVDDNPGNVERARSRGLKTVLFQDEDQFVDDLKTLLDHPILTG